MTSKGTGRGGKAVADELRDAAIELCKRGLLTCTSGRPGEADATYALAWLPLDNAEAFSPTVRELHAENTGGNASGENMSSSFWSASETLGNCFDSCITRSNLSDLSRSAFQLEFQVKLGWGSCTSCCVHVEQPVDVEHRGHRKNVTFGGRTETHVGVARYSRMPFRECTC